MEDKALLEAIGKMMDQKLSQALEPINTRLDGVDKRLDDIDQRLDKLDHKSDVLMTGVRLANSKLTQVSVVQNYTIEQLELLDEVKMDKDPLRKRA